MIFGEVLESRIQYSAGMFRHDGKNSEVEEFAAANETLPGGNRTLAARIAVQPIGDLQAGVAYTRSDVSAGLSTLPGVTVGNQVFFPRMYASGTRARRGVELRAKVARLSIQGEMMDAVEQRLGQGLRGEDLPNVKTQGWYVSAVHPLFGRLDAGASGALHSLLPGMQLGLFELAARYETIRFGSVSSGGANPSRSARAANVVGNEDRVWSFGLNWRANRYVRLQLNGIRETLRDPVRTPLDGKTRYGTVVARFQIYF
jgi:phosphate-selective porin